MYLEKKTTKERHMKKKCGCETLSTGVEYINPLCSEHAERCGCDGCWACKGQERGCTCHIDWDEVYGH